jgi:Fur family peroxide stress response transcriptional regulator
MTRRSSTGVDKRKPYATRGRREILDALAKSRAPLSAKSIHGVVGPNVCDLATVHRSLRQFIQAGLVNEVFVGGDARRYEINEPDRHHHHVSCLSCASVADIPVCRMTPFARYAEEKMGYEIRSHSVELFGVCPSCRARP